jgi:hypothetical protein
MPVTVRPDKQGERPEPPAACVPSVILAEYKQTKKKSVELNSTDF